MALLSQVRLLAVRLLLLLLVLGDGCTPSREGASTPSAAGDYVVLADSSRVHVIFERDGKLAVGALPRVLGSLTFTESSQGFLNATGRLTADLAAVALDDTAQSRALADLFLGTGARRDYRTAELRVRDLSGQRFTTHLPLGGVTPVTARAQLIVYGRSLSRDFKGEITRTPFGYRLTTAVPLRFSIRELRMEDELGGWSAAVGVGSLGDGLVASVDLSLARREEFQPETRSAHP